MAGVSGIGALPTDQRRATQRIDLGLLLASVSLVVVGLMTLFSISYQKHDTDFKKQLISAAIGLVPFSIFAFVNAKFWLRSATVIYIINVLMLAAVLSPLGVSKFGAQRWIPLPGGMQFQPSDLAKLLTIITLASFFAVRQESIHKPSTFFLSFVHVAVPLLLIYEQPHLGSTLAMLVIWFCISMVANVPNKFLLAAAACIVMAASVVLVPALRNKVFHGYQLARIEAMFTHDAKGADYQTTRAEIAFGVGSVFGTGYLKGEQKAGGYVPFQQNDFVFSVIGEEGGLVGCTIVLGLFGFFFYRVWRVMFQATDPFYRMIAAGIFGVLAFHTVVNVGMVLGLLPVVGLWLPFISYGGTALWLCMASVGLLLQIRSKEKPLLF